MEFGTILSHNDVIYFEMNALRMVEYEPRLLGFSFTRLKFSQSLLQTSLAQTHPQ